MSYRKRSKEKNSMSSVKVLLAFVLVLAILVAAPAAAFAATAQATVDFNRLYNPTSGDHFYTESLAEKNAAVASGNYLSEGVTYSYDPVLNTAPLCRLYNPRSGDHFYTTSASEMDAALASGNYVSEGIAATVTLTPSDTTVYRLYNPTSGDHFLTASSAEKDAVAASGNYVDEGIAYYIRTAAIPVTAAAISGTPQVGLVLTASTTPAGATVTYQWQIADEVDGVYASIAGATLNTYTILPADSGRYIRVVVTATGSFSGTATSAATAVVAPLADTTAPTVSAVAHNESAHTITYTFSEPIQLRSEVDPYPFSPVTADKLDIYTVVAGEWDPFTPTTGIVVTGAAFDGTGTIMTVTYTGNLVNTTATDYVVDATDYGIVDLPGNLYTGETGVSPVFTVAADTTRPVLNSVVHNGTAKTITLTYSEAVHFETEGENVTTPVSPAILDIFVATANGTGWDYHHPETVAPNATISAAEFDATNTVLTVTYTGNLVNLTEANYVVDSWGYDIKDVAGNADLEGADPIAFNVAAGGAAIPGVTPPAAGDRPVTNIEGDDIMHPVGATQYTGNVTWSPNDVTFAITKTYTATIILTAKTGYTLEGVAADYFDVAGASFVANSANSGVITAVFPATGRGTKLVLAGSSLGGISFPGNDGWNTSGCYAISGANGLDITLSAPNPTAALVLITENPNSEVKYVQRHDGDAYPSDADFVSTYTAGVTFNIDSSTDRIWLKVTDKDVGVVRYYWINVTVTGT